MAETARARAYRLEVLPDKRVGMTTFNRDIRRGLTKVGVADRACELLREHCEGFTEETMDHMCAMAYLVGTLNLKYDDIHVTEEALAEAGFHTFVVIGARRVHGLDYDTAYNYHTTLMREFDEFKLVKGALHIAELEELADAPPTHDRKRKVVGDAEKVRKILLTAPLNGMKLAAALATVV